MAIEANRSDLKIGVIGVGAMGRGIAQVAAAGGLATVMFDTKAGAAEEARAFIAKMLDRQVEKNSLSAADADAAKSRLTVAATLADLAGCHVVIEAIVENLEVKRALLRELEGIVTDDAILASNTSSIRIAAIAAACRNKSRVAGLHFFNPVPLMKLVEVVAAPDTDPAVTRALVTVGERMTRTPVVVQDGPGFLVNLGGRAFYTEGLRIVHERIATPAQVDAIMRDAGGFRMGPFELMDLTGIDVNFPASTIIYNGYFQDRRLATSPLHESLLASGRFGRKTKSGYYRYDENGNKLDAGADAATEARPIERVALAEPHFPLVAFLQRSGVEIAQGDNSQDPIVAAPIGEDCTAVAARTGADYRRLIAIDLAGGDVRKRVTVMTAPGADLGLRDRVIARIATTGAAVTAIADSPGFVAQRIRAAVANLGCEMAQIGIAAPADIDLAMRLGLNYPLGPLEIADAMGPKTVLAILERLQAITGDDRYRPSQWLRRRALLGLAARHPG
ncbi:MAG: 3-hydroxyacyl-CoA dehydrogenase [Alphaproteobacteria bacterium]|nr:3-hydroxyacyl-CoA dehydrogenase [Alphaproteobacteria bacterium]